MHFGDQQVFPGATTYTCLLFLDKAGRDTFRFVEAHDLEAWRVGGVAMEGALDAQKANGSEWNFAVRSEAGLIDRLAGMPTKLGAVARLFVGLQTDADDVYILEEVSREGTSVFCRSKATGQLHEFENDHLGRLVKGSLNVRRYHLSDVTKRLIFPYEIRGGTSILLSPAEYRRRFPLTWRYLEINRSRLAARGQGRLGQSDWHGYVYRKNHTSFGLSKLLVPSIARGSCFAADLGGEFYFVGSGGGGGGGYGICLLPGQSMSYCYLLGILNSRVASAFLRSVSTPFRGGYFALNRQYIQQLPIRTIDFSNPADVARHDRMVALVEQMLDLHKKLAASAIPEERALYQRQIEATDRQIDALVYELYGLTEEEIAIVEGAG